MSEPPRLTQFHRIYAGINGQEKRVPPLLSGARTASSSDYSAYPFQIAGSFRNAHNISCRLALNRNITTLSVPTDAQTRQR